MTLTELSLFVEGSESLGRQPLSPPLLRKADLSPKFSPKESRRGSSPRPTDARPR